MRPYPILGMIPCNIFSAPELNTLTGGSEWCDMTKGSQYNKVQSTFQSRHQIRVIRQTSSELHDVFSLASSIEISYVTHAISQSVPILAMNVGYPGSSHCANRTRVVWRSSKKTSLTVGYTGMMTVGSLFFCIFLTRSCRSFKRAL